MCLSAYTHTHTLSHPFLHASVLLVLCQIQLPQTLLRESSQEPIKAVASLSQTLVKQWDLSAKAYGISLAVSFIYLISHHYESPSTHTNAELINHSVRR